MYYGACAATGNHNMTRPNVVVLVHAVQKFYPPVQHSVYLSAHMPETMECESPEFMADVVLDAAAQRACNVRSGQVANVVDTTAGILESLELALADGSFSPDVKTHLQAMKTWPNALPVTAITRIFAPGSPEDKVPCVEHWLASLVLEQRFPARVTYEAVDDLMDAVCAVSSAGNTPFAKTLAEMLPADGSLNIMQLVRTAAKFGAAAVLQWMLDTGRIGISLHWKAFAVTYAAKYGQCGVFDWLRTTFDDTVFSKDMIWHATYTAAMHNHECVLHWLITNAPHPSYGFLHGLFDQICETTTRVRPLRLLRRVYADEVNDSIVGGHALTFGVRKCNMEMIHWATDECGYEPSRQSMQNIFREAAARGFVEVAAWLVNTRRFNQREHFERAFAVASRNGHVHFLVWLTFNHRTTRRKDYMIAGFWEAAKAGHVPVLQWYKDNYGNVLDVFGDDAWRSTWLRRGDFSEQVQQWLAHNVRGPSP